MPFTVIVYVPVGTDILVVSMVNIDEPSGPIGLVPNVAVHPDGTPDTERFMLPENPPIDVAKMVKGVVFLSTIVLDVGNADSENDPAGPVPSTNCVDVCECTHP